MNHYATACNANNANQLNVLCAQLNQINDQYPRHVGTMVMVSPDTENQIEAILNEIDRVRVALSNLSDEEIGDFTNDVPYYREFLAKLKETVDLNRQEVARAREFLSMYYSH